AEIDGGQQDRRSQQSRPSNQRQRHGDRHERQQVELGQAGGHESSSEERKAAIGGGIPVPPPAVAEEQGHAGGGNVGLHERAMSEDRGLESGASGERDGDG